MKKPEVPNAFNTPGMFKPDMTSFRKSKAGLIGGAASAKKSNGDAVPGLDTKNSRKWKKQNEEKK